MDKASDFGSEDCEFESRRGRMYFRGTSFKGAQNKSGLQIQAMKVVGKHAWLLHALHVTLF